MEKGPGGCPTTESISLLRQYRRSRSCREPWDAHSDSRQSRPWSPRTEPHCRRAVCEFARRDAREGGGLGAAGQEGSGATGGVDEEQGFGVAGHEGVSRRVEVEVVARARLLADGGRGPGGGAVGMDGQTNDQVLVAARVEERVVSFDLHAVDAEERDVALHQFHVGQVEGDECGAAVDVQAVDDAVDRVADQD
jgi:hypothetical protein